MTFLTSSAGRAVCPGLLKCQRILLFPTPLTLLTRTYTSINEKKQKTDRKQDRLHKIISKSRILSKLNKQPRFAHYFDRLSEAGVTSTVTSFLVLHELTAVAPLFGMWYIFYQLDLPEQYELPVYFTELLNQCGDAMEKLVGKEYSSGFDHNRLILAGAISYAIVKLFYPLRVLLSLWGAPYMGRWLFSPFRRIKFRFSKKTDETSK